MDKMKSMGPESKLEMAVGPIKTILIIQYGIAFAFAMAVCVSAGYYLFNVETDTPCGADGKDVAKNFNDILIIYFVVGLVDSIRTLSVIIAAAADKK